MRLNSPPDTCTSGSILSTAQMESPSFMLAYRISRSPHSIRGYCRMYTPMRAAICCREYPIAFHPLLMISVCRGYFVFLSVSLSGCQLQVSGYSHTAADKSSTDAESYLFCKRTEKAPPAKKRIGKTVHSCLNVLSSSHGKGAETLCRFSFEGHRHA